MQDFDSHSREELIVLCKEQLQLNQQLSDLQSTYGLHLALGEITGLLHALARRGRAFYEELLEAVRGSPYVHADETGWREDGANGYVWSFSNRETRLYLRDQSRGQGYPQGYPHEMGTEMGSGGMRSPKGTDTKMVLAILYGTRHIRNLDPLHECSQMLTAQHGL